MVDQMSSSNFHHIMRVMVPRTQTVIMMSGAMIMCMTEVQEEGEEGGDSPEVHGGDVVSGTEDEASEIEVVASGAHGNMASLDLTEK